MNAKDFRRLALALPGASEVGHMGHPDFRVNGKIFATLGYPDNAWAVVKVTPERQSSFVKSYPAIFKPVKGVWGLQGNTNVHLEPATEEIVGEALTEAWRQANVRKGGASRSRRKAPHPI
jgi:hypothetical protein